MPAEVTAAAAVFQRPVREQRLRAPRQEGRRAQITVPLPVWERAEELADAIGTTPNDILAIFASKGMELAERQLETARIAAERTSAYSARLGEKDEEPPTIAELVEAAQALRAELDDDG